MIDHVKAEVRKMQRKKKPLKELKILIAFRTGCKKKRKKELNDSKFESFSSSCQVTQFSISSF